MVRRIVSLLSQTIGGMHAAAYVIAIFSLVSQVLGLVRDRMLAHLFGAGSTLDVYYAAFRIPDFIFASIASIVSLFVLIPFLESIIASEGKERARHFLSEITSFFIFFITLASALLFFFAPQLGRYLYPGFGSAEIEQFTHLTRILLLSPIFLGFSNILAGVTQLSGRFIVYALSPIVYNIGIIAGIIFLYPRYGLSGIGWGVVCGALLHALIQIPVVVHERLLPRPVITFNLRRIWNVVSVSLPRTLTLALNQVVLLVLVGIASTLAPGSVTIFTFASNLYMAPLTLIGVAYSVAAFPTLSKLFVNGEREAFIDQLVSALRHIIFWSFPALTLMVVLRAHIVRTLLGSGAFDWADTRLTAAALALFLVSLIAHGIILLFVRAYYAAGMTARPLIITMTTSIATVVMAFGARNIFEQVPMIRYFFESLLRISDVGGTTILVIAFVYSLGLIASAMIFWILFRRDFGGHIPRSVHTTFWQSASASIIGAGASYVALNLLTPYFDLSQALHVFVEGLIAGVCGILFWVATLQLLRNQELVEFSTTIKARFWKTATPIAPETGEM